LGSCNFLSDRRLGKVFPCLQRRFSGAPATPFFGTTPREIFAFSTILF